jgi:DNA replication and repair protein RecF
MKLIKLSVENFRNIEKQTLEFSPSTTLIYGNNAEGKTNIVEAVYMFAHSKSFRRAREKDLIRFGEEEAKIEAVFEEKGKECRFEIRISRKSGKTFYYNGIRLEKMREFFGHFLAVLFVPEYLKIIKSGPSERRAFLDSAICQIKPSYISTLFAYHKLCEDKNALLKSFKEQDRLLLEVYNERLAKTAASISRERLEYLKRLEKSVSNHFEKMSGKDKIELQFMPSGFVKEVDSFEEFYKQLFEKNIESEIKLMRMTVGAQLDDIEILINSVSSRSFASQGQQRSAVIALKLAEGEVVGEITKRHPIYLFDDILSELDEKRREYILSELDGKQVIITSCQKESETEVYTYLTENGRYRKI